MPESSVSIRRATPGDLDQLWPLLEHYYAEWDIWQRDTREEVLADLTRPAPFGFVVAERDGTLVGCVLLRPLAAIPEASECKRLFVIPELRGQRLASQLMTFVEDLAQSENLSWIFLDTKDEFTAAIALYRTRGYESCERYNDNPQATFFFRKRLRPFTP